MDQTTGVCAPAASFVTCVMSLPSAFARNTCGAPARDDRNASFLPSAENAGLVSDASPVMSAFGGADPSEGTIQMSPLRRPV